MNWLGNTWRNKHNNRKLPSMKQISDGLIAEAKFQLLQAMGKISTQKSVLEAQANIAKTWEELFALSQVNPNQPLESGYKKDENGRSVKD